jgi:glycerophosphoryl diester phosphodiesterase
MHDAYSIDSSLMQQSLQRQQQQQQQQQQQSSSWTCMKQSLFIAESVTHRPRLVTIAHRGASFHVPEHSLAAYRLALELGADYIEPDIVVTRDGVLLAHHSVDLNATTNVAQIYPQRSWYSPTAQRTSYWTFNFTYQELSRVTLRQRLPSARTTLYDGLWSIPRLQDILQVLIQWNRQDLPQMMSSFNDSTVLEANNSAHNRQPNALELRQAGVYAELKESEWLLQEANLDLVTLLFQHMHDYASLWDQVLTCFESVRFNEYKVPPLIIQSFEVESLRRFHNTWMDTPTCRNRFSEPPYVLLVEESTCHRPDFWVQVGVDYRSFVQGIGCDKACLLPTIASTGTNNNNNNATTAFHNAPESLTLIKAHEFGLGLHPWTVRPEEMYFTNEQVSSEGVVFTTVEEELLYLACHVQVQGVFTESVTAAQVVFHSPCPLSAAPVHVHDTYHGSYTGFEALLMGITCFALGMFLAVVMVTRRIQKRQTRYERAESNPDAHDDLHLEMT